MSSTFAEKRKEKKNSEENTHLVKATHGRVAPSSSADHLRVKLPYRCSLPSSALQQLSPVTDRHI